MTKPGSPLSVRLDAGLEAALDNYCARAGLTRSHVVQEGIAQYLASRQGPSLSSLAEQVLPPPPAGKAASASQPPRQRRYREYVREKRRR